MMQLLAAFAVFVALHSVPATPAIRARLVGGLGHGTYIALYSIVSLLALTWLFYAALALDYVELWPAAAWQGWITFGTVPLGLFLVLAGLFSRNPYSATARRGGGEPGAIVAITRHPVIWGFVLWAAGHIPPNGDLRSVILFGGFAMFSAASMAMLEKRAQKKLGTAWPALARSTSVAPFAAIVTRRATLEIDGAMIGALAVDVALIVWLLGGGHQWLFGADPLAFLAALQQ